MRRDPWLLFAVFLLMLTMTAGCKRGADAPDTADLGPSSAATSTVLPVGSPQCPGGGIGIYTGSDANGNGVLEAAEIVNGSPVCDPLSEGEKPGGHAALVMVASEPTGTVHCAAGGLKVQSGPDVNRSGLLDADEITLTEYLCNGKPGASSAAGITVTVSPPAPPADKNKKEKKDKQDKKAAPAKKPQTASGKTSAKAKGKAELQPAAEAQTGQAEPAAQEGRDTAAEPAAPPKKGQDKAKPAASNKEKNGSPKPAPKGWTAVKVSNPQIASAAYKIEGRYITVRFTNLSKDSAVRFKYTVRWKVNQNGSWVDDSTMEGISFRLKPQESLDREVRTPSQDIRDITVDLDVVETS